MSKLERFGYDTLLGLLIDGRPAWVNPEQETHERPDTQGTITEQSEES
jgi:hypothetical protein